MPTNSPAKSSLLYWALLPALILCSSCHTATPTRDRVVENKFPKVILWAWERPENLEFLDPERFGVAFLAQTLVLQGDQVVIRLRRQPLRVAPKTKLIAVTRIESRKTTGGPASLSPTQRSQVVSLVTRTMELKNVAAIQIDFDAVTSERSFYRSLLEDLRGQLPDNVPLTMTALASFCVGDRWIKDLPVDEAVPMIFRMGADNTTIRNLLASGNDFRVPLCQRSYGIAVDEPVAMKFDPSRRLYVFNVRPWTERDVIPFQ
ncbi:MAG TPA: hypothetical protein VJS64_20320 [Pyrinomonadaceae bacterium]|nr:hypothetical protein [Pyrinomonadaceae bacterium]